MVGRAAGLPESQLRETSGREDIASGAMRVRGLPSKHGKVLFGRVPFPGDITEPPAWPPRTRDLRHGLVLNWLVKVGDFSLVHVDSAELINEELQGHQADVVCLCAAGWHTRPDYVADAVRILKPRFVFVCHWDTMLTPLSQPMQMIPGLKLAALLQEVRRHGVEPLLLPQLGEWQF
jgi:L-ascorbate metabolism protein UlaG (beta-lactamase superfamily)